MPGAGGEGCGLGIREPENKRWMNLPRLGLGGWLRVTGGCLFWGGMPAVAPGGGQVPRGDGGSHCRRGWLMARLRWRVWHRFLPRQLGTSCAEAASEDTGPAASLGLRLFFPPAFARNTFPSFCWVQTGGLILGEGLDGLKLVAEKWLNFSRLSL